MKKVNLRNFNYRQVAELDCRIWQAYYAHNFFKMAYLTYKLLKTQLKLNGYLTLRLAYWFGMASKEYRLNKRHLESDKTLCYLTRFYATVSENSIMPFNHVKAARAELEWWNIQRYKPEDTSALVRGLSETFAIVYSVKAAELADYGRYRAEALDVKNHYMHRQKKEVDWDEIRTLLYRSWGALHAAVQK